MHFSLCICCCRFHYAYRLDMIFTFPDDITFYTIVFNRYEKRYELSNPCYFYSSINRRSKQCTSIQKQESEQERLINIEHNFYLEVVF
jgi:hypothetical protein